MEDTSTSRQLSEILGQLPCWGVSLAYGSMLRLEFGAVLERPDQRGSWHKIGSGTIWLDSDQWILRAAAGDERASSSDITREATTDLERVFKGVRVADVRVEADHLTLSFDNGWTIEVLGPEDSGMAEDDDLLTAFLPDGRIAAFTQQRGLHFTGEVDAFRASGGRISSRVK